MLQSIVLNEATDMPSLSEGRVETWAQKIPVEIVAVKELTWEDGGLKVARENATLTPGFQRMLGYLSAGPDKQGQPKKMVSRRYDREYLFQRQVHLI